MENVWRDTVYGARRLVREPGFTAVAVVTLALGIGLNSAIFSLVDGVLLRPVPYERPEQLVFLTEWSEQVPNMSFSIANFEDVQAQGASFEALGAVRSANYTLTGAGDAERLDGRQVSAGFFEALRLRPLLGRTFGPDDDRPGAERVAVLSEAFWARRFGRDPHVLGRPLLLDGESYAVAGVVPSRFHSSWRRVDVFTPLLLLKDRIGGDENRGNHPGIYVVGRLAPGASVEAARTEVEGIAHRLAERYPSNARQSMTVKPLTDAVVGPARPALLVLLGAVALVLLIACANVANLLLARGAARPGELAVRTALGASRGRVVRQLLTESVLLALVGGVLGIVVAFGAVRGLLGLLPDRTPGLENVGLHAGVLLFTLGLSLLTGVLFGLAPAWRASRPDPHEALREGGRSLIGGGHRLRHALLVAEVSVSLVLLVGAGLLMRSFVRVLHADPGFVSEGVLTATVSLPESAYGEPEARRQFTAAVLERVNALPGVGVAASTLPLLGGWQTSFRVEGEPEPEPGQQPSTDITRVSPGYFEAMGVRLLRGRLLDERDHADSLPVCVVDETFARRYWPGQDPIGKRIHMGHDDDDPWIEVVGVVRHVKNYGVDEDSRVETYLPYTQSPMRFFTVVIRTEAQAVGLAEGVRRAVLDVDPTVPVFDVESLDEVLSEERAPRRLTALLTGSFALLALALAAVGIYGVMSYNVTRQTSEIGIRLALGADPGDILRMVVSRGMTLAGLGLAIGLAAALGLSRLVASLLFQVSPTDPPTFSVTPLVLGLAAFVACYLPARRATRVEPTVALRYE